ncbi:MAG: MiaB/RimO family radical SAM methylthiotransferase, partial [Lachnospiraceae bacterium]|nr:MiaB/RimO family radical SAM methylthiotransferase [Lachnospiraceae bacterium]
MKNKMKIFTVSLGCDKNLVDTEKMLGYLQENQYELTDTESKADVIIVNTCAFIRDAKEESIQTILDLSDYKTNGNCKALLVTGCLGQRYAKDILEELPEVDGILGTNDYSHLTQAIENALNHEKPVFTTGITESHPQLDARVISAPGHSAYLKIAEGCDKHCTYCIIPSMRGSYRSFPLEELMKEAQKLISNGVKELILVAQETTLYGTDLYGKKQISVLLDQLNQLEGLEWIRILYCYPEEIDDEFIDAIRRNSKVCHYLDMPIQHASNHVLKQMGRKTTKEELISTIQKIRTQ